MIYASFNTLYAFDLAELVHNCIQGVCILYINAYIALKNAVMAVYIDLSYVYAEILWYDARYL